MTDYPVKISVPSSIKLFQLFIRKRRPTIWYSLFQSKILKLLFNNHKFYLYSSNNAEQVIGCNQGSSPGRDRDPGQFWILGQYRDSGYAKSFILRTISLFSKKRPSHKINEISLKKMGSRFSKVDPGPVTILYGDCQVSRHAKIFSTNVKF